MFGEGIEQLLKGYTKEDEFIARDFLLIELLIEKGFFTTDEINEKYEELNKKIEEVKKERKEASKKRLEKLEKEYEKSKDGKNENK